MLTAGPMLASGYWTIGGATVAALTSLTTDPGGLYQLSLRLSDGSQLVILELPEPTFRDGVEHELTYTGTGNVLVAGHEGLLLQNLHVGDETCIRGAEDGELALNLSCGLVIASEFTAGGFVASEWDTRHMDVTLKAGSQGEQVLELISAPPQSLEQGPNVVFADVACDGKLRDLVIAAPEGDVLVTPVRAANARDNQTGAGAEAGIYRHVTVGDNRTLTFSAADGYIWWYDAQPPAIAPSAVFYLDGVRTPWTSVVKRARCTAFGDWNGDGFVKTDELKALQNAVQGGAAAYNALMDCNCDGVLDNNDINKFLGNYGNNLNGSFLLVERDDGLESDEFVAEGLSEDTAFEGDAESEGGGSADLATWLTEQLSPEDLAAFISQASATAEEHGHDAVGTDLTQLLSYLQ